MKKILSLLVMALLAMPLFAQEEEEDYPVMYTFETSILADNQTVMTPYKGMMEFEIHHRFGLVTNGHQSLFGIYSPSNIRLGLNYGVTDRLMIGAGATKDLNFWDLQGKYAILQQTESGAMPVSLSYYGNIGVEARADNNFGPSEEFKFYHKMSYFHQLIVARKFSETISLQLAPTFIWFNAVETGYNNANFGLHAGGKWTFVPTHSLIFEYDYLFTPPDTDPDGDGTDNFERTLPQIVVGWEKGTATHAFQLFFANYKAIIGQRNFVYNKNDFWEGEFLVGMNVTVRF
ncbi:MAG TPA: DUF5777 family beta-barrel protein [Bacteroidales bacterium]|nr:DUF5777 family beta-barrel protein [Bacteroidales bacterium]